MSLPEPTRQRWQPLRAGVIDLFYYDTEEFHFHHGCLLLRGNNGTGKSKILALTVPFLLDGDMSSQRVEPDGDRHKRMEWNLLLGGKYPHPERLGYTWLEFGRQDTDGTARFITLGCGLKAATGRGMVRHWFFVTSQRIGQDLRLLSPTGTALLRERLREAIGEHGFIYDKAGDYRRAVDEALFGLGTRYDALISLLIQLRQPQLSKRPDERLLSAALTQALPPLDDNLVAQAAEAFRSLDDEREALVELRDAKKAADEFVTVYRRYARIASKRTASGPRQTQAQYQSLGRELGAAEQSFTEADDKLTQIRHHLKTLEDEHQRLTAHRAALVESPEARAAENLERQAQHVRHLKALAQRHREAHTRATDDQRRVATRLSRACDQRETAAKTTATARTQAQNFAHEALIGAHHTEHIDPAATTPTIDEHIIVTASRYGEEKVEWRHTSLRHLRELMGTARAATDGLREARRRLEEATRELAGADERIIVAEQHLTDTGRQLLEHTKDYFTGTQELIIDDAEEAVAALAWWVDTLDGPNPAHTAVTSAYRAATAALTRAQSAVEATHTAEKARAKEIAQEIRRLERGGHNAPPVPYTRMPHTRADRPGAPLWRVIDFASTIPAAHRAGIEAALEASGILDGWLCPDGTVVDTTTHDVLLVAHPNGTQTLDGPLIPAIDRDDPHAGALSEQTIRQVLGSIGYGRDPSTSCWVDADGHFALGVLTGRWAKAAAQYIGEGSREAARRARIADLRAEATLVEQRVASLAEEADVLHHRQDQLSAEHDRRPSDTTLVEAHTRVREEKSTRRRLADHHDHTTKAAAEASEIAERKQREVTDFASDVGLPPHEADLTPIEQSLSSYRVALATLWPAVRAWREAAIAVAEAEQEFEGAAETVAEAAERHAEAQHEATRADEHYKTLLATVGTAVAELRRQLEDTDCSLRTCGRETHQARLDENTTTENRGKAAGARDALAHQLQEATAHRDEAVEVLRSFASTGLLSLACPEVEVPDSTQTWAATPSVTLARAIDRSLDDVDDSDRRWDLAQQSVNGAFKQLMDGLSRHGHQAVMSAHHGTMLVDVTFQGRTQPVAGLAGALDIEIAERQRVLSAREREVLETHLVNEVAGTLQELISAAEQQVAQMNRELEERPTSTGMRLRLVWRPSKTAPAGLAELRGRLLRQTSDVWNDDDRQRVGSFLHEQIAAERLRDDASTWHEQLSRALDYRDWHEFVIQRYAEGQWRSATGPASGGERVLAASIPLFAAASSYYSSAGNPHAPRLIALDEAFAGVDDDSRAKCLGLLARFDLDVVMTSEREWGCYPQVPGLAISQLARRDGIDAVLVTGWRWDGHGSRYQVPRPRSDEKAEAKTEAAGETTAKTEPAGETTADDTPDGLF